MANTNYFTVTRIYTPNEEAMKKALETVRDWRDVKVSDVEVKEGESSYGSCNKRS